MTPEHPNSDGLTATSLAEWLHRRGVSDPARPALTFADETLTFAMLNARAATLAAGLSARGIGHGERVAYLGFNHPVFIIALFACARLGAIFVPLNFRLTGAELAFILGDANPSAILCDAGHRPLIDGIRSSIACNLYLTFGSDAPGWDLLDPLVDGDYLPGPPAPVDPGDTAIIMYTSGTTGSPKGAELTHLGLWANNINWLLSIGVSSGDVGLNCAPLYHVGGLCVVVLPVLMAGGHVVLQNGFDPLAMLNALEKHRATLTFAVPVMMQTVSQLAQFEEVDLSALRLFIAGGASVPEPLLRRYIERGILISQGWGMTESATAVTFLSPNDADEKVGSCGKAVMLSEFRLVDPSGNLIEASQCPGEIRVRGTNVMRRYWNRPDATDDAFDADGWFRSGDVGYVDEDGFLFICDRLKDMIISGGENIYPAEVEGALFAHPAILEVAVVGAPDEQWGERVVAFVVTKPGQRLTLEALRSFAGEHLARYKLPSELRLVEALPRNSSGKVLKQELRKIIGKQE